jgi:hypothetical protein
MSEAAITVESMRDKLYPLDYVRDLLARTEPLTTHQFTVGDEVRFIVQPGWHHGLEAKLGTERVEAAIVLGRGYSAYQWPLTKDALLEATSACGINGKYVMRCPSELIEPQLNYWFRAGLAQRDRVNRDFQLLVSADMGAAITRSTIVPFSNLRLVDQILDGVEKRYGKGEVLADYKLTHSLRRTHVRLIVPEQRRVITGTGVADDEWSTGIQLKNSIIGAEQTSLDGYLFRFWCTNGAIDTHASSGIWSRRGGGTEDEVYAWARHAVDEILGGLEPALDRVQETVHIPIEGHANEVLRDVFDRYRTPVADRTKIIENMVEAGDLTMYSVMSAITQAANNLDMDPGRVEALMRMGGDIPHAASGRCGECFRLMPS